MLRSRSRRSRSSSSVRPTCLRSTWPPAASSWVRSRAGPCHCSMRISFRRDAAGTAVSGLLADCDDWQEVDPPISSAAATQIRNRCVIPPRETQLLLILRLRCSEIVLLNRVCGQVGWRHVYKCVRTAGGQAGGEDDPFLLSSFPLKPSAARVEPAGVQPGESVAGGWHCRRGLRIWLLMEVAKMELGVVGYFESSSSYSISLLN